MKKLPVFASALWAAAALLLGHEFAYRIVFTDAATRAHALEHSGHGWLGLLLPVAVVALVGGAATSLLVGARQGAHGLSRRRMMLGQVLAQSLAYLAVETGERLLAGHGTGVAADMFSGSGLRLLAVGLALQAICGVAAILLAYVAEVAGASLAAAAKRKWAEPLIFAPATETLVSQALLGAAQSRGPPAGLRTVTAVA